MSNFIIEFENKFYYDCNNNDFVFLMLIIYIYIYIYIWLNFMQFNFD
jgi:hypothetical protein